VGLKKLIAEKFGVKPTLSMGGLGALDIFLDGKRIFSYREAGHMPEDGEIISLIQSEATKAR
jgi:hypothetical protein